MIIIIRGVHESGATYLRVAQQDSHSILSTSTFTQPLLAQASELAACMRDKRYKRFH
ncbi:hypothetical protein Hdeb2414_s0131g00806931 [Helianthus debilis subsp. tardiflorus]